MNQKTIRLGELFCGPGGLGLGARWAARSVPGTVIEHAWATDYDENTCRTYAENIVPGASYENVEPQTGQPEPEHTPRVYCADIREMGIGSLPPIDALAFGAPCNDWSSIGERKGLGGQFGALYTYGVQVLESHRPKWFLFENVGGIRGEGFDTVCADFRVAGYRLYPHFYDFSHYGVPQRRKRVIVIGVREDLDVEYRVPAPLKADVSAGTALSGIPADAHHHEAVRMAPLTVDRLNHIKPGQNAWTADLPEHLRIRTRTTISSMYRRLKPEQPSYTVTGAGGGGYHIYHWDQPRSLTNRERARLQSFPDDFVFAGGKESVRKQIGMAVPPRGAQAIFEAVLNSFSGIDYPSVEPSMSTPEPEAPESPAVAI